MYPETSSQRSVFRMFPVETEKELMGLLKGKVADDKVVVLRNQNQGLRIGQSGQFLIGGPISLRKVERVNCLVAPILEQSAKTLGKRGIDQELHGSAIERFVWASLWANASAA